jgi:large subunit ribosomal protein L4|tara:strand:+ start:17773 stop:18399 length:627 start_codon:yes stop_codon:yes gene_type:complete
MKLDILKTDGSKASKKAELKDDIYGIDPNEHAVYLDVKQYLANQRQGTSKSKERAEISGSTRKIKKQKGTGTARAGSIKSPLFKGGGRVFGPKPRTYDMKLNKKVKSLARRSALTTKAQAKEIIVLEDFDLKAIKTADMVKIVNDLKLTGKKSLLVLPELNKNVYLSSRNLQGFKCVTASELSTYVILNAGNLILSEGALGKIESQLS